MAKGKSMIFAYYSKILLEANLKIVKTGLSFLTWANVDLEVMALWLMFSA